MYLREPKDTCVRVAYAFLRLQIKRHTISPRKRQHCSCSLDRVFIYPQIKTSINYYICVKSTVNQSMSELKVVLKDSDSGPLCFKKLFKLYIAFSEKKPHDSNTNCYVI